MSDIPAARVALRQIADDLRAIRHDTEAELILAVVASLMHREPPLRLRPLPMHQPIRADIGSDEKRGRIPRQGPASISAGDYHAS